MFEYRFTMIMAIYCLYFNVLSPLPCVDLHGRNAGSAASGHSVTEADEGHAVQGPQAH